MGIPSIDCSWLVKQQEQSIMDDQMRTLKLRLAQYKGKDRREGLTETDRIDIANIRYWLREQGVYVK